MSKKNSAIIYASTMILSKGILQFVINKFVAIIFGPSGLGLFGQWQNLSQILVAYANGAINNGVIIKTALFKDDAGSLRKWCANAIAVSILASFAIGGGTWYFAQTIQEWFFPTFNIISNLHFLAIVLPFSAISTTLLNIAYGCRNPSAMSLINLFTSLTTACFFFFGVRDRSLNQLMITWSCIQIGLLLIHFVAVQFLLRGPIWISPKLEKDGSLFFARHTLMAIVGSTAFPLCYLVIRKSLTINYGEEMAGCWDALQRISNVSMAFFAAIMASFLLPKYASLSYAQLFLHLKNFLYLLFIPYLVIIVFVFLFGGDILELLYSDQLRNVAPAFHWQIAGDYFRVGTFLLSNVFVSRAAFLSYATIEITASVGFYLFYKMLVPSNPLVGASQSHFCSSLISFTMASYYLAYKSKVSKNG